MKPLIISTIAFALLSTTVAGIAASQDTAAQGKVNTVKETSALATLKKAFRFGLQTGWQKDDK